MDRIHGFGSADLLSFSQRSSVSIQKRELVLKNKYKTLVITLCGIRYAFSLLILSSLMFEYEVQRKIIEHET